MAPAGLNGLLNVIGIVVLSWNLYWVIVGVILGASFHTYPMKWVVVSMSKLIGERPCIRVAATRVAGPSHADHRDRAILIGVAVGYGELHAVVLIRRVGEVTSAALSPAMTGCCWPDPRILVHRI